MLTRLRLTRKTSSLKWIDPCVAPCLACSPPLDLPPLPECHPRAILSKRMHELFVGNQSNGSGQRRGRFTAPTADLSAPPSGDKQ